MTSVNVTTTKNTVTVNGETRVVTVKTQGPQGPAFADGDIGDIVISGGGTIATIDNGVINNAKIASNAAIAGSKIDTSSFTSNITITNDSPIISLTDSNANSDFQIKVDGGHFDIKDVTNNAGRLNIQSDGTTTISGNLNASLGVDVTGNISVTGTVDGRDVAADGTKLDGIETGATADQTASEIKTAYESNSDTNAFTDADHSKLDGIETAATADQTAAEIKTLLNSNGIVNSNVDASAAIDGSKISPSFTSNIFTTGQQLQFSNNAGGRIKFSDANNNPDYMIRSSQGKLQIDQNDDSTPIFKINTDGHVDINNNLDCGAGVDVTGNITVTGTVDGVDIATRDTLFGGLTSSSGVLTNGVTATTQSASDNSTKVATTAYTDTAIANLVDSAPGTLNTLNELAAALGDDANFSTTVTNSIATKLPLAGGTLTGNLTISRANPRIIFTDTDNNPDYLIDVNAGHFLIYDSTNSANRLLINSDGHIDLLGNVDITNGLDVTGTITATSSISVPDDVSIFIGTGNDLSLKHDGSSSRIRNDTGALTISCGGSANANPVKIQPNEGEEGIVAHHNERVELYFDNSKKLETTSSGITVSGSNATGSRINGSLVLATDGGTTNLELFGSNGVLRFHDSRKASFGTSDDLQIYHDGSNSYIQDLGTGQLRFLSNDYVFYNAGGNENIARFIENDSVELYYDNSKKLETTSTGATVTGNLTVGALLSSNSSGQAGLSFGDNVQIHLGADSDLKIYHDGTHAFIADVGTGNLSISTNGAELQLAKNDFAGNFEHMVRCIPDAAVELYHDGSKKFETTSSGATISGNLELSSTYPSLTWTDTNHNSDYRITNNDGQLIIYDITNSAHRLNVNADGNIQIPADNKYLQIGASQDLEIVHTGSQSAIQSANVDNFTLRQQYGGGYMFIHGDNVHLRSQSTNELYLAGNNNNAVELYFDNSKKFETTANGNRLQGLQQDLQGDVKFDNQTNGGMDLRWDESLNRLHFEQDNIKAVFGTGSDLEIYHGGGHSIINDSFGSLLVRSNIVQISTPAGSKYFKGQSGVAELYYDDSKKFETTSTGVSVNERVGIGTTSPTNQLHIYDSANANDQAELKIEAFRPTIRFQDRSTSQMSAEITGDNSLKFKVSAPVDDDTPLTTRMTINTDGTVDFAEAIKLQNNKNLNLGNSNEFVVKYDGNISRVQSDTKPLFLKGLDDSTYAGITMFKGGSAEKMFEAFNDGAVKLYYDAGASGTPKLATTATGVSVTGSLGIGATPSNYNASADNLVIGITGDTGITVASGTSSQGSLFFADGTSGTALAEGFLAYVHSSDYMMFGTSNTERMRIDSAGNVRIPNDNAKLQIGASQDLEIYHDGSKSVIADTGTGGLFIAGSSISLTNDAITETMLYAVPNGAVALYYDNSKKFETSSDGVVFTGAARFVGHETGFLTGKAQPTIYRTASTSESYPFNAFGHLIIQSRNDSSNRDIIFATGTASAKLNRITSDGHLDVFGDNQRLRIGASQDLQIYHSGSHSFIDDVGTGDMYIRGDNALKIQNAAGSEQKIVANSNGSVDLYYDHSKKLETTSNGVKLPDNSVVNFGNSSDLQIYHNGSSSYIDNTTGNLYFRGSDGQMLFRPNNNEDALVLKPNGAVELYYDNVTRLGTTSTGVSVVGTLACTSHFQVNDNVQIRLGNSGTNDFVLVHDGTDNIINCGNNGILFSRSATHKLQAINAENMLVANTDGAVELYYDNSKKLETTSYGVAFVAEAKFDNNTNANRDVVWDPANDQLRWLDSTKATFGTTSDLEIIHNGTDSRIINNLSDLFIYTVGDHDVKILADSQNAVICKPDAAVELYYDNVKKLETTTNGITVTGSVTTQDMNMSNLNGSANEVDNTKGSWSIQEGSDDLFIINRVTGKKYKFNLTEIS